MLKKWTHTEITRHIIEPLKSGLYEREIAERLGISQPRVAQLRRGRYVPKRITPPPTMEYTAAWVDWAMELRKRRIGFRQIAELCFVDCSTVRQRLNNWGSGDD